MLEERQNFAKDLLSDFKIETIGAAYEYCDVLIKKQIERAENTSAPMNEAVYGDGHARRAITTLLPDVLVRELFLKVTRDQKAWPRLRPLFGAPPYVFLNPGVCTHLPEPLLPFRLLCARRGMFRPRVRLLARRTLGSCAPRACQRDDPT